MEMSLQVLLSDEFWESSEPAVLFNTRAGQEDSQLGDFVSGCESLRSHLLFATSGSTGVAKWVALSKDAILASAQAVNEHLGIGASDRWGLAIPTFHVGGMGIVARAFVSGASVCQYDGAWEAKRYANFLQKKAVTWTSLVPAQVADIVAGKLLCPCCLKGAIIGGGAFSETLQQQALALGWPVLQSYGMSEAASQIATEQTPGGGMKLLPHIEAQTTDVGLLRWRGKSMFSGYVRAFKLDQSAVASGWFTAKDRVKVEQGQVIVLGRSDLVVKVLGELVDIAKIEEQLNSRAGQQVVIVPLEDERRGVVLVPVVECGGDRESIEILCAGFSGVERLRSVRVVDSFPRSELGKIKRVELKRLVGGGQRGR